MGRTGASGDTGGSSSSLLAIRSPPPATPRRALALKSGMALFDPWLMLWFRQVWIFFFGLSLNLTVPVGIMADKSGLGGESESIADKYFVCTECLVEGNVQSFVDLFYLVRLAGALARRSPAQLGRRGSRRCGGHLRRSTRARDRRCDTTRRVWLR